MINQQRSSGLSIVAFCQDRQVSPASFHYWKRRLKSSGIDESNARKNSASASTPPFVAIDLPPAASDCEVVLQDGCRVVVPARFETDALRRLLAVLRERPC